MRQRAGRCTLGLESQVDELGEKSVRAIARLAVKHDRRRPPIDVVENLIEIDIDIGRPKAVDADTAVEACCPEKGLYREAPLRRGLRRGFGRRRLCIRSDRRRRNQHRRQSCPGRQDHSDDSHIPIPSKSCCDGTPIPTTSLLNARDPGFLLRTVAPRPPFPRGWESAGTVELHIHIEVETIKLSRDRRKCRNPRTFHRKTLAGTM